MVNAVGFVIISRLILIPGVASAAGLHLPGPNVHVEHGGPGIFNLGSGMGLAVESSCST